MSEEILYINIDVRISNEEYYNSNNGKARVELNIPADMIDNLNVGNIFEGCIKSAIVDYRAKQEEKEE